jgi:hypothetical protein
MVILWDFLINTVYNWNVREIFVSLLSERESGAEMITNQNP